MKKDIKLLSLAFLLIFAGYNSVQQYVTTYFTGIGESQVGFRSLILIYIFFAVANPLASIFTSKYGSKLAMLVAAPIYGLYIFSISFKNPAIVYLTSSLLGMAASFIWTGETSYLMRISEQKSRGKNSGFFNAVFSVGSVFGLFALGYLSTRFALQSLFQIAAFASFLGFLFLFFLRDVKSAKLQNQFVFLKKIIFSKTAIRVSLIGFVFSLIFGVAISLIPVQIGSLAGVEFIGPLTSVFYFFPIIMSYSFGSLSDVKGRRVLLIWSFAITLVGLFFLYLSNNFLFLIIGVLLTAVTRSLAGGAGPVTVSLIGDISDENNLDFVTALFWMMQNFGVVVALFITLFLKTREVYLILFLIVAVAFLAVWPILKTNLNLIQRKVSQELS